MCANQLQPTYFIAAEMNGKGRSSPNYAVRRGLMERLGGELTLFSLKARGLY